MTWLVANACVDRGNAAWHTHWSRAAFPMARAVETGNCAMACLMEENLMGPPPLRCSMPMHRWNVGALPCAAFPHNTTPTWMHMRVSSGGMYSIVSIADSTSCDTVQANVPCWTRRRCWRRCARSARTASCVTWSMVRTEFESGLEQHERDPEPGAVWMLCTPQHRHACVASPSGSGVHCWRGPLFFDAVFCGLVVASPLQVYCLNTHMNQRP